MIHCDYQEWKKTMVFKIRNLFFFVFFGFYAFYVFLVFLGLSLQSQK